MPLSVTEAQALTCCASKQWANKLVSSGPFPDFASLLNAARRIWWSETGVAGWLEAFAAHPKIGDKKGVEAKPKEFGDLSRNEQAAAARTITPEVEEELRSLNEQYFEKFGFIFIVFAKGKTAPEMLAILKHRIQRLPYEELQQAATEQMKITEIRLAGALDKTAELEAIQSSQKGTDQDHASGQALRSPITTHVLDQAMGKPAEGLPLQLLKQNEHSNLFEKIGEGVTNEDGRVGNLLPPSNYLPPGTYRMFFNTAAYLELCKKRFPAFYAVVPFYPEVVVEFNITPDTAREHYHIPLLLSPYGYSTYRGS